MLTRETIELSRGRRQIVFRGGSGPTLVWLHGADGIDEQSPLLAALAERYSLVAPLAPGFDDLEEIREIVNVHELALHYDDVFDALGLEGAAVAGHSFGGMVAAELAAHVPSRVAELVLVAPIGLWNDAYPVADAFAVRPSELPALLFADPASAPPPPEPPPNPDDPAVIEENVRRTQGLATVAKFSWPIPEHRLAQRLDRVKARTLVVFGAEDRVVPPRYADDFVALIPNASKRLIPDAGHLVTVERADALAAAIDEFLGAAVPV